MDKNSKKMLMQSVEFFGQKAKESQKIIEDLAGDVPEEYKELIPNISEIMHAAQNGDSNQAYSNMMKAFSNVQKVTDMMKKEK